MAGVAAAADEKMAAPMRRLHLLRHAKSSWADEGLADRDRPLSNRGRRACDLLAAHLTAEAVAIDLVLASPARRVVDTIAGIDGALRADTPLWTDERLYTADADDLLGAVAEVPAEVRTLLVVSHNPAIEDLASRLIDDDTAPAAVLLRDKYPTGALATFALNGNWATLLDGTAKLLGFVRPRDLEGSPRA